MRDLKQAPRDNTPPKMIINSHGAVAIDPKTFLDSGIVQGQIAAVRDLRAHERALAKNGKGQ